MLNQTTEQKWVGEQKTQEHSYRAETDPLARFDKQNQRDHNEWASKRKTHAHELLASKPHIKIPKKKPADSFWTPRTQTETGIGKTHDDKTHMIMGMEAQKQNGLARTVKSRAQQSQRQMNSERTNTASLPKCRQTQKTQLSKPTTWK